MVLDITSYLYGQHLITKQQHGFLNKRSKTTNLLESVNDWSLAINNHKNVTVAYIDYAKAFDTVCHSKLICKLSALGISGNLLLWIKNFLSGRTQRTRIGSTCSEEQALTSGVIQGSCLGPLLFLIYINDVVSLFDKSVSCKLYADDIKLYTVISTNNDCLCLQRNLDLLYEWSNKWQLTISYKKCAIIDIGHNVPTYNYSLHDNVLVKVSEIRDLGIVVDPSLKFSCHINKLFPKAYSRVCLIYKCFVSQNRSSLVKAYTTYVRPLVEYSTLVWFPHLIRDILKMESIQRRFSKRLRGLSDLSYKERLKACVHSK
jgi:ribonuclease P/MRP protein subunit RPP40